MSKVKHFVISSVAVAALLAGATGARAEEGAKPLFVFRTMATGTVEGIKREFVCVRENPRRPGMCVEYEWHWVDAQGDPIPVPGAT